MLYLTLHLGEDFWRWQTMNPNGYKGECSSANGNGIAAEKSNKIPYSNGNHVNGDGIKSTNGH